MSTFKTLTTDSTLRLRDGRTFGYNVFVLTSSIIKLSYFMLYRRLDPTGAATYGKQ